MTKDLKSILQLAIKNLLTLLLIVVFIIIFSAIFGSENQLIGVGLITGMIMFKQIDLGLNKKQAPFIIFTICIFMAISNIVSFYSAFLGIIFNIFNIYLFMSLSTVHLAYKTYIPFVLMYIFADGVPIEASQIKNRVLSFLISGIFLSLIYAISHRKLENGKTIKDIFKEMSLTKETTVFNIKMTLGLTIAMFLINYFNIQKGMWISITVMSLTQPHFHITKERIKHRSLGTIIGFILYLLIFGGLIPTQFLGIITALLAYIYTFIKNYYIQIIFITINSLNAAKGIFNTSYQAGIYRLSFIFLGIIIALFTIFIEKMLDKKVKIYPDDLEYDEMMAKDKKIDNMLKDENKN